MMPRSTPGAAALSAAVPDERGTPVAAHSTNRATDRAPTPSPTGVAVQSAQRLLRMRPTACVHDRARPCQRV